MSILCRSVAFVLCALVVLFGAGCRKEPIDADRIMEAEGAALRFLGDEQADLVFVKTLEYYGIRALEFQVPATIIMAVDEKSRVIGYERLDLPEDGDIVVTGRDAFCIAEAFVRRHYEGFADKNMAFHHAHREDLGLEGYNFPWDGTIGFGWTEVKHDLATPNSVLVAVNAFCGQIKKYSAKYHIEVPDIEISCEEAQTLALAQLTPKLTVSSTHAELLFDHLPWLHRNQPNARPYWKVSVNISSPASETLYINIDAVTGERLKHVSQLVLNKPFGPWILDFYPPGHWIAEMYRNAEEMQE